MVKVTVSVSALLAMVFGFGGLGLLGAVTLGLYDGTGLWGLVLLMASAVAIVDCRIRCTVERVVERHVGGLVEREVAAFHLGRSRE